MGSRTWDHWTNDQTEKLLDFKNINLLLIDHWSLIIDHWQLITENRTQKDLSNKRLNKKEASACTIVTCHFLKTYL